MYGTSFDQRRGKHMYYYFEGKQRHWQGNIWVLGRQNAPNSSEAAWQFKTVPYQWKRRNSSNSKSFFCIPVVDNSWQFLRQRRCSGALCWRKERSVQRLQSVWNREDKKQYFKTFKDSHFILWSTIFWACLVEHLANQLSPSNAVTSFVCTSFPGMKAKGPKGTCL